MPFALQAFTASRATAAVPSAREGVMPVVWNQVAPSRILSQSKSPGFTSAMEDPARS